MKWCRLVLTICACSMALITRAQITNVPLTKLEAMEAHTQTVIVKSFAPVGSLNVDAGVISVRIKSSHEINTGRKLEGISIEIAEKQQAERIIVDFDEADALLQGIEFVTKVDYDVSRLPGFEAAYSTRAGFRISAYTSRRSETIRTYIQGNNTGRVYFTANQLAEFLALIKHAKNNLDSLREQR